MLKHHPANYLWNLLDLDEEAMNHSGLSVYHDKDALCVEASLPGVTEDDIDISLNKDILRIEAEKKEEKEDKEKHYYRKALRSYSYRVVLPCAIDEQSEPQTSFKNGILTLRFKKSGEKDQKKIKVKKG
jgi:HSP20 family protein